MDKFIYTYDGSLSPELCKDIINLFEQGQHYRGETIGGFSPNVKNTWDLDIMHCDNKWDKIKNFLVSELTKHLTKYKTHISMYTSTNISEIVPAFNKCFIDSLNIQKYEKNKGLYITHVDDYIDYNNKTNRMIVFMWYLNDLHEGGETEFNGTLKVKPEAGKLVLFPSTWTYPHTAIKPLSSDKYIITGWFWRK